MFCFYVDLALSIINHFISIQVKDVFLPWYNAYRFLVQNAKRLEVEGLAPFTPIDAGTLQNSSNVLDQWINSATQSLVHFVHQEMNAYRLYTVSCF
jgi:isoleucyl-tRNA synthetase